MRNRAIASTLAIAAASALLLSACSKDDAGKDPEDRMSLNEFMGGKDYDNEDYQALEAKMQEAIAVCMQEEGWEYKPVTYPGTNYEYSEEDELERIKREGFGIAYYALYPNGNEAVEDPWAEWVDPNQDYVESLSPDEQTAYYESLNGTEEENAEYSTVEIDPETGEEYTFMIGYGAGCQGDAYREVYGDDPTQNPTYYEAMEGFYADLQSRVEADPRMIKLNEEWVGCMKDKGQPYTDVNSFWEESYNDFQKRVDEIVGENSFTDPMEGWTQDQIDEFMATATDEDWQELYKQPEPTGEQKAALEAILADEIAAATAQFECSKPLNDESEDIYADIEEQFIKDHEDELKEIAASLTTEK